MTGEEMSNQEKIELINSLRPFVVDFYANGTECEYVSVELNDEVRSVLHQLGKNDDWIAEHSEGKKVDIEEAAWEISSWWSPEKGFSGPL